jgi:spore coat protein CotH
MQLHYFKFIVLIAFIITSCSKNETEEPLTVEGTEITKFSFLKVNNPVLETDVVFTIVGNKIAGNVPLRVNLKDLVASFEHNGLEVTINNYKQISGVTYNDFSDKLIYTVRTSNGRKVDYTIEVFRNTGLPVIYLTTNGGLQIDSKDDYRLGTLMIEGGINFSNLLETPMKIKGRGNSTWWLHPKKPYQLKFDTKLEVLKMPADKTWLFLAEYSDKTLIRNKIAFEMGYLSKLDWTPKSEYADVFINNQYNGLYHITQKVEVGTTRVNIGSTGYLLEIDQLSRLDADDVYFNTGKFLINIKAPELVLNSIEYTYIKNYVNEFESVLMGSQFKDPINGYAKYIDTDSFIDWYLISEITKNQDSKDYSSIYFNVIPGQKLKMGPLWDFDLAFGNVDYSDCRNPNGFWVKDNPWIKRLFEDPAFVSKVKSRFLFFKEQQNLILSKMDSYSNDLKISHRENNMKWNLLGTYVWPNPVYFHTQQEEVNHLKSWYTNRMNWLTNAFNSL